MGLEHGDMLTWLLVALPAGLFAAQFVPGRSHGTAGDIGVGLAGALVGGLGAAWLGLQGQGGRLASFLATVVGAVLLTRLARAVPGRSPA